MKRNLLLLSFFLIGTAPMAFSQVLETYYTQDFWDGFTRNEMNREDYDYGTIVSDYYSLEAPFAVASGSTSKGWVMFNRASSDMCAVTPTKYTDGRASDSWLATPAIELPDVDNLAFVWDARSYRSEEPDGYEICVSTTGNSKADFTDEPIAVIDYEEGEWTTRYASLDAYRGQTVYIAMHSNTAGFMLMADNFEVSRLEQMADAITLEDLTPQIMEEGEDQLTIEGRVVTEFGSIITSAHLSLTYDGGEYEGEVTSFAPASDGSLTFRQTLPVTVPSGGSLAYSYTLTSGDMSDSCSGEVYNPAPSDYERRVVIEERTGTWCQYCIRGLAAIDACRERFPDNYIGIAVHNQDIMADSYYDGAIAQFCDPGYPAAVCNRVTRVSPFPDTFISAIQTILFDRVVADVNVRAEWANVARTQVDVNVYTNFSFDATQADFNVALVLVEQDVYRPGDSNYNQRNGYAHGSRGTMGGYEAYGDPISSEDIHYPDVARGIYPEIGGELAYTSFDANTPALYSSTIDVPSTVLEKDNIEVVALLINPETNEILNAARVAAADFGNMDDPGLGIAEAAAGTVSAYNADGNLLVDLTAVEGSAEVTVFGISGVQYMNRTLQGGATVDLGTLPDGLSIVAVACEDGVETFKLMN